MYSALFMLLVSFAINTLVSQVMSSAYSYYIKLQCTEKLVW